MINRIQLLHICFFVRTLLDLIKSRLMTTVAFIFSKRNMCMCVVLVSLLDGCATLAFGFEAKRISNLHRVRKFKVPSTSVFLKSKPASRYSSTHKCEYRALHLLSCKAHKIIYSSYSLISSADTIKSNCKWASLFVSQKLADLFQNLG
jgi:hypothetical protein